MSSDSEDNMKSSLTTGLMCIQPSSIEVYTLAQTFLVFCDLLMSVTKGHCSSQRANAKIQIIHPSTFISASENVYQ